MKEMSIKELKELLEGLAEPLVLEEIDELIRKLKALGVDVQVTVSITLPGPDPGKEPGHD